MEKSTNLKFAPTKKTLLKLVRRMGLEVYKSEKYFEVRKRNGWRGDKELNWYGPDGELRFVYCFQDPFGCFMVYGRRDCGGREHDIEKSRLDDALCRRIGLLRGVA